MANTKSPANGRLSSEGSRSNDKDPDNARDDQKGENGDEEQQSGAPTP